MNKPPILLKPTKVVGDKPGDWMEVPQNLANGVHFFLSGYVLLLTAFFTRLCVSRWWVIGGVELFLVVFVLAKEFWYDLKYETGETVATSAEDALGWLFGNLFTWAVIGLAHWTGLWP